MDRWKRHLGHVIGATVAAVTLAAAALWVADRPVPQPPRKISHTTGEEETVPLNLVQPYPGGTVRLSKMWYHENHARLLRIFAHFKGEDPRERFLVENRVRDEKHGFDGSAVSWFVGMGNLSPPGETMIMLENAGFPAAAETLFMRLYFVDKETRKLASTVDFEIKNPLRRPPEPWPAEPLPATRLSGPLKIELLKMETRLAENRHGGSFPEGHTRLVLRVLEHGAPVRHWHLTNSLFTAASGLRLDGTGGEWMTPQTEAQRAGEGLIEVHPGTLWKGDGTWKAQLHFEREKPVVRGEGEVDQIEVEFLAKPTFVN
jgi:hypothetical protein